MKNVYIDFDRFDLLPHMNKKLTKKERNTFSFLSLSLSKYNYAISTNKYSENCNWI